MQDLLMPQPHQCFLHTPSPAPPAPAPGRMDLDSWLPIAEPLTGKPLPRRTLLMLAAQDGSVAMMQLALAQGASVNLSSPDDGATALHCAAASAAAGTAGASALDAIRLLLEFGADRDLLDRTGRRPLDVLFSPANFCNPPPSPASNFSSSTTRHVAAPSARSPSTSGDGSEAASMPLRTSHRDHENTPHSSADFRMYHFKIDDCPHGESPDDHDWTECAFAHPGEKARRRCPRKFQYASTPCPDFRKGTCKRGDACTYAHGVFEGWLHPDKYRTQMCKDGMTCNRLVCFFAHTLQELRAEPQGRTSIDGERSASSLDDILSPRAANALPTWSATSPCKPTESSSGAVTPTASDRDSPSQPSSAILGCDLGSGLGALSLGSQPQPQAPNSPFGHLDGDVGLSLSPNSPMAIAKAALSSRATSGSTFSSRSSSPARRNGTTAKCGLAGGKSPLQGSLVPHTLLGRSPADAMLQQQQEQSQLQVNQQQQLLHSRSNSRKGSKGLLQKQPGQQLFANLSLQQLQRQQVAAAAQQASLQPSLLNLQLQEQAEMLRMSRAASANIGAPLNWHLHSVNSEPMPLASSLSGLGNAPWPARPTPASSNPGMGGMGANTMSMDNLLHNQLMTAALMGMIPEQAAMRRVATLPGDMGGWANMASPAYSGAGSPVLSMDTPMHAAALHEFPNFRAQQQQQLPTAWPDSLACGLGHLGVPFI